MSYDIKFSDIYGHEQIKERLARAIDSGKVSHAYLFEGIRGVGKMTTARAFAAALVCENREGGDSCSRCHSCSMCRAGSHPDVRVVENSLYGVEKKSDAIAVETIRGMKNEIYVKPYIADRKIYIIPNADTMTEQAQNSLLKVLEEPPQYCTLILLCENSGALLPTVMSRVVKINFSPLASDVAAQYMTDKTSLGSEKARLFARMGGGSIGRAVELSQDETFIKSRNELMKFFLRLISERGSVAMYDFSKYLKGSKSSFSRLSEIIETILRDIMLICHGSPAENAVNADRADALLKLCGNITPQISVEMIDIFDKYSRYAAQNVNYNMTVHCMVMEWWEKTHDRDYRNKI